MPRTQREFVPRGDDERSTFELLRGVAPAAPARRQPARGDPFSDAGFRTDGAPVTLRMDKGPVEDDDDDKSLRPRID